MKKIVFLSLLLMALYACQNKPAGPAYIVQVYLGGWDAPD